jgi:hypothetical protein
LSASGYWAPPVKGCGIIRVETNLSLVRGDACAKGNGLNWESNRESCTAKEQPLATTMHVVKLLLLFGPKFLLDNGLPSIPLCMVAVP